MMKSQKKPTILDVSPERIAEFGREGVRIAIAEDRKLGLQSAVRPNEKKPPATAAE